MTGQHAFRTVIADELATVWPRATVVDVRSREEHATAHVPGSLNIPLDELPSRLADLPNTTLYLLCGSGKRSSQARADPHGPRIRHGQRGRRDHRVVPGRPPRHLSTSPEKTDPDGRAMPRQVCAGFSAGNTTRQPACRIPPVVFILDSEQPSNPLSQ
ncbi:rhodanese-like domain-containing protein [Pseudarthrobacter sp. CC12]|uniref:rhodanese-like domain-containing protein n=1 Tax=Pseudarthrobacter sp. CC12 TaxID=3029193 RepID=UPI0032661FBA